MARRSGLGRGLEALIPVSAAVGAVDGSVGTDDDAPRLEDIPIGAIEANPHQPRQHFDEETLTELTASIREIGVLQPVLLRPVEPGRYQLIAGERRWRAAQRAGLATIPAIVRTTDDLSSVEQALVENLQREDLSPLEEAGAYQELIDDFGLSHEQVAIRVGKSRAAISNTLRLLQLPPAVKNLLANGRLSAGHARALLATPDRSRQEALALRTVDEGLSVRALEDLVRGAAPVADAVDAPPVAASGTDRAEMGAPTLRPPGLLELEELLSEYLHTRVRVSMGGNRGKMVIEYADLEDLERIYRRMTEPGSI
jgi:ParB family transcriptional regulator, chromosome partitioning protein